MDNQLPTFLDCEASSLSQISYPIEIGFSLPDGTVRAYLIRPEWDWSDWDFNAESVHGLSREEIMAHGLPADHVARLLNDALGGRVAYSDAPEFDGFWLERLYEASGVEMEFQLAHFDSLFPDLTPERIAAKSELARYGTPGRQHRAAHDVKFLQELYKLLRADHP
ncbi:MAG: hypothetical protein LC754_17050 [Acidobacteria bacterium]|nr:hypothetical protein [Acidobacteriota bacterium]